MMTKQQNKVYQFILEFYVEEDYYPSLGDIAYYFDYQSRNAAAEMVSKLVNLGLVHKDKTGMIQSVSSLKKHA